MLSPEEIKGRLIAAVPTPFDVSGDVHRQGLRHLVSSLVDRPIGGVAVGTVLGRGVTWPTEALTRVLATWREGLGGGRGLIALAGASPAARLPADVFGSARLMAHLAASRGADALLVHPPGALRGRPERDRLVLEYHSAVAEAGLPMLVSYRREASGGIAFGPDVLAQLLARPEVLGVEIATIDGIVTFQQVEALARELAPGKSVVSGEERFLGYSLMCGADSALVGIGSAFPSEVLGLLEAHASGDAARFLDLSARVDALARAIFAPPFEGAARRLLWAFVHDGTIPPEAAHDPRARPAGPTEFDRLGESLARIKPGPGP